MLNNHQIDMDNTQYINYLLGRYDLFIVLFFWNLDSSMAGMKSCFMASSGDDTLEQIQFTQVNGVTYSLVKSRSTLAIT